jgi:hypothetical protein
LFLSGGATLIYMSRRLGGLWSRGRAYPTGKPSQWQLGVLGLGDAKTAESLAEMYGDIYIRAPPIVKMKASPPARITHPEPNL